MEQINNNLKATNDEVTELKNMLKGNMYVIYARQLIWDETLYEVKNMWDHITLVVEKNIIVEDTKFFILLAKEEDGKYAKTKEKFIKCLNEKATNNLRTIDIVDRTREII